MNPTDEGHGAIRINTDQLPADPNDVLEALMNELAPLDVWLNCAVAYLRGAAVDAMARGQAETHFTTIMEQGTSNEIVEHYDGEEHEMHRVAMLSAYAAYHASLGVQEHDEEKKTAHFNKADECYAKADSIDPANEDALVGKGFLYFSRGDEKRALDNFLIVRNMNHHNIPAILGEATLKYNKGDHHGALQSFQDVLKSDPGCPANVRLGIALCLYQLKEMNSARHAFQRVLELDPASAEAMAALAVLDINAGNVEEGMQWMARGFSQNPRQSAILNHLANFFFMRGEYPQARDLATKSLNCTKAPKLLAEAHYQLARAYHVDELYNEAFQHYSLACKNDSDYVLPTFGLGQMYIYKQQFDSAEKCFEKAEECFEKVLEKDSNCWEAMRLLGTLYARNGRHGEAMSYLKKVTTSAPRDVEARIELAELLAQTDLPKAKEEYQIAVKLIRQKDEPVPREITNNLAVVLHMLKEHQEALQLYEESVGGIPAEGEEQSKLFEKGNVTITYNIARLREDTGMLESATVLYNNILKAFPHYIDCYLRLAAIEAKSSNFKEASSFLHKASALDPKHIGTIIAFGNLHLGAEEFSQAQKRFEEALSIDKYDEYALISYGNVYLHSYRPELEYGQKNLDNAIDFYSRTLRKHPNNIFAAQGIACSIAEKGRFEQAKEMFDLVREGAADSSDTFINSGHCYLQAGHHVQAVKTYQQCLNKFHYNQNIEILQYLAHAHYDASQFEDSVRIFQVALRVSPNNYALWFNIAVAKYKLACSYLDTEDTVDLEKVTTAGFHLKTSCKILTHLSGVMESKKNSDDSKESRKLPFTEHRLQHWLGQCQHTIAKVAPKEEAMRQFQKDKERRAENQRNIFAEAQRRQEEEKARKRQEEQEKAEARELRARENAQKLAQLTAQWEQKSADEQIQEEMKKHTKGKKGKKDQFQVEEEAPLPSLSADMEADPDLDLDDMADDDDDANRSDANQDDPNPSDDDDDAQAKPAPKRRKKIKRKGSDDDSDDDDDDGDKEDAETPAENTPGDTGDNDREQPVDNNEEPQDSQATQDKDRASPSVSLAPGMDDVAEAEAEVSGAAPDEGPLERKRKRAVIDDSDDDD